MPYYCTVPRCTSMAGKAKNVSFHQFPRDEELAKLWNNILKRGKPYTKYSKVCSLHFKPEDYTITSAGKNKGQWRTLRKDAIPSQNLPSDTPAPYTRRQSSAWVPHNVPALDPQLQHQAQQLAQAFYMQTMLAMQTAGITDSMALSTLGLPQPLTTEEPESPPSTSTTPEIDTLPQSNNHPDNYSNNHQLHTTDNQCTNQQLRRKDNQCNNQELHRTDNQSNNQELHRTDNQSNNQQLHRTDSQSNNQQIHRTDNQYNNQQRLTDHESLENKTSYRCDDCSKCFKDPDVFILHKRTHKDSVKENFDLNTLKPEMLKSNPILANLLMNTMDRNIFSNPNIFEKQLMVSFSNMENYFRNVSKYDEECDNSELSDSLEDSTLVIDENVV